MIALGFMCLGGAVALAFMALICGLCHADTAPPIRTVAVRGQFVDVEI